MALMGHIEIALHLSDPATAAFGEARDVLSQRFYRSLSGGAQYNARKSLAASGTDSYDLSGTLTNARGGSVVLATLTGVLVRNTGTVAIVLKSPSNGVDIGDGLRILPGQLALLANTSGTGHTVTAATADLIAVTNESATTAAAYDIALWGTTA